MKAYMSNRTGRHFGRVLFDGPSPAEHEALAILAETEDETGGRIPNAIHFPAIYMSQRTLTHETLISQAQLAITESLSAFVED